MLPSWLQASNTLKKKIWIASMLFLYKPRNCFFSTSSQIQNEEPNGEENLAFF